MTSKIFLRAALAMAIALGVGLTAMGQGVALAKAQTGAAQPVDRLESARFR